MNLSSDSNPVVEPTRRRGIISAGTWTMDRIKLIDTWPAEEHLAVISEVDQQGGGSGHNLGVDIRKLDSDMPVEAIGLVGSDNDGDFLVEQATSCGMDTSQLHRTAEVATSYTDVFSSIKTGKRTFFHFRGASDQLAPAHFDFTRCNGRILHLGLLGLHATMDSSVTGHTNGWVAVLKAARSVGIQTNLELVSIEPARIRSIAEPCLPYLDSLIVNEFEIASLSGVNTTNPDGTVNADLCIKAAQAVIKNASPALVVVHYPSGAVAVTADRQQVQTRACNMPQSDIISSVGAGDAFAAGLLYGVHEQWELQRSLNLAHAVAAASMRSATTVGAVESIAACLKLADGYKQREISTD